MRFMLDTNIIAYARRKKPESLLDRLARCGPDDLCISVITLAELEYGVSKSAWPERNALALAVFLSGMRVVPFSSGAAREYGDIRASLERRGLVIGGNDMLIAAQARSMGLTLVTNNQREFERVEGLNVENWV